MSLNVRGLKNSTKRKAIFLFCKDQKSQCVFLQETHSVMIDEKFWKLQWGDYAFFAHGTSHSAGVMILFNRFPGSIIDGKWDTEGHWLMVVVEINDKHYILICIYGYNNKAANINLYAKLSQLINEWKTTYCSDKVILGGDHNIAPDSWLDRIPHRYSQPVYDDTILNLCTTTCITDYWRTLNPTSVQFTWYNSAGNGQCSRLDYWLISSELCNDISNCDISPSPLTDHCMISLNLVTSKQHQNSPNIWKFNNNLLQNVGFCDQVKSLILEVEKLDMSDTNKWEWFKFEAKRIAINTGKQLSHIKKQKQKD